MVEIKTITNSEFNFYHFFPIFILPLFKLNSIKVLLKMRVIGVLATALLACRVYSQPYEYFPLSEQLPDVARVGKAYSFQISDETYASNAGSVSYSAEDLPAWLSFDNSTRTLTGTPGIDDVSDSEKFTLVGTDVDGQFKMSQSIVVSNKEGPEPSDNYTVLSQLAEFGQTNGNNGLVLSPGEVFNVTFDQKTFTSDDSIVAYYGRSSDRTPLPNWLFFDSSNLRFSGVAPAVNSEIAPGFIYSFIFIASDYTGYFGNSVNFNIVVGAHELTTSLKDTIRVNGSAGDTLDFNIPLESVYQDNQPVSLTNISSVQLNGAPDWVKLNNYTLTGNIPSDFNDTDIFNVTIYDLYSNSVSLYFEIEPINSLFAVSSFRSANATRGSYFQYYFLPTDFTDYQSTNITVDTGDASWIEFHQSNLTLNGETPDDFDQTQITVQVSEGSKEDQLAFQVYGIDPVTSSSSSDSLSSSSLSSSSFLSSSSAKPTSSGTASSTTSTTQPTSTKSTSTTQNKNSTNHKALAIGLGVGLGMFVVIVASLLLFCCCYRKRKAESPDDDEKNKSPKISKPILGHPANGPQNTISPGPYNISTDHTDDDSIDEPQRLGALNVLKLDEKNYYDNDGATSSTTNVDSLHDGTHSSIYQDALQFQDPHFLPTDGSTPYHEHHNQTHEPIATKSWRQTIDSKNRESLNSLASVSTNELLSMRLAEDDDIKKDPRKSSLSYRDSAFFGSTASSILTRDDSGNIQRLDSNGNIVETLKDTRQRASKATDLDILDEETTPYLQGTPSFNPGISVHSSSTGEEFYPDGEENGDIKWEHKNKFTFEGDTDGVNFSHISNNSKARLMTFNNKGRADTSNDTSTGEDVEILSPEK